MADEKKELPNLDDWDSLPLDPGDDDWDDIPPLTPAPKAPGPDRAFEARLNREMNRAARLADAADEPPPEEDDDFDQLPDIPLEAFGGPDAVAPVQAPPEPGPDDFQPAPPPGAPAPASEPEDQGGADEGDDGPGARQRAQQGVDEALDAPEKGRPKEAPPVPAPDLETVDLETDIPATTKVELDIEGIFLDDVEGPKEEPPAELVPEEPRPEEKAEPEVPPPPAEAPKRKIPRVKLLFVGGTALLVLVGLGVGLYKFFFSGPKVDESQAVLVIDPQAPPRDPVPGDLELPPFYLNFSGPQGETIVEMTVTLYYPDLPDRFILEERMAAVRDIIARAAKEQGGQVVTSAELQRALRQSAADQVNSGLGGPHLSYVQISQIRVLR
ncbi:MAG: flagellar basal body-associated FliL family protein [Candidatus Adiutrix sp.]|jgi:flagellar basal body-associated protein FliL|nr:flagellar basal body-associated FliL family protein [Candidatus Adiutrix sp.]